MSLFQGENMVCSGCKFEQKSHPLIESGWIKFTVEGDSFHLCPECGGFSDPKCPKCGLFYHQRYGANCPWCQAEQTADQQPRSKGFGRK